MLTSDANLLQPINGLAAKAGASAVASGLSAGAADADPFAALMAMLGQAIQTPASTEILAVPSSPSLTANMPSADVALPIETTLPADVRPAGTVKAPALAFNTAALSIPAIKAAAMPSVCGAPAVAPQVTESSLGASLAAREVISPSRPPTQAAQQTSAVRKPQLVPAAKVGVSSGAVPPTVAPQMDEKPAPAISAISDAPATPVLAKVLAPKSPDKPDAGGATQDQTSDEDGASGADPLTIALIAAAAAQPALRTASMKGSAQAKTETAGPAPAPVQGLTATTPDTHDQRATVAAPYLQQQQPTQTGAAAPSGLPATQPLGPVAETANASGLQSLTARAVTPDVRTELAAAAPVLPQVSAELLPVADQPPSTAPTETGASASVVVPPLQAPPSISDIPAFSLAVPQQTVATPAPAGQSSAVKPSAPASRSQPTAQPGDRGTAVAGETIRLLRSGEATPVQPVSYSGSTSDDPVLTADRGSSGVPVREKEAAPALQTASAETQPVPVAAPAFAAVDAVPVPAQVPAETVTSLAAQIASKSEAKTSRFDVKLTPEGLGQVNVSVEIAPDGRLSAKLDFERPEVASALHDRSGELQEALAKAGFDLSGGGLTFTATAVRPAADTRQDSALGFGFSGQGAGQGGNASQNQGGGGGSTAWSANAFAAAADLADQANRSAWTPRANAQGVDVRV